MNFCAITRNRFLPFPLVVVVFILCLLSSRTALLLIGSRNSFGVAMALTVETRLLRVSEQAWRAASQRHADEIRNLLSPGLIMDPVPSARAINPTNGLTALDLSLIHLFRCQRTDVVYHMCMYVLAPTK